MDGILFDSTKLAAYFLWEQTGCDSALNLWYCAEDMACYFEQTNLLNLERVQHVVQLGIYDLSYVRLVRHVAYRIYVYANHASDWTNWFAAERLLSNPEWVRALTAMASVYRNSKTDHTVMDNVRSDNVRSYYDEQTFHTS